MRILRNDGISVVALVIVILLLSTLGITLTSLIITKQKSTLLPLKSTQAFYAAQAGIEYAIRHTQDNYDDMDDFQTNYTTPLVQEELSGIGYFEVTYNDSENFIKSTGTGTAGTAKRVIKLASFRDFLTLTLVGGITLDPENPPYNKNKHKHKLIIPISNNTGSTLYIFKIDMAKDLEGELEKIKFDTKKVHDEKIDIGSDHSNPTQIDFSKKPYYALPTGTTRNEFKFKDKVAKDTYTVIYHYYFEGGSEADNYTSEVKFTIS